MKLQRKGLSLGTLLLAWAFAGHPADARAAEPLALEQALEQAYAQNPELAELSARASAESAAIRSRYAPANPRVGWMREVLMNRMQEEMGPMNSWTVSQELLFPTKYLTMGGAQGARADAALQDALDKKLEIRQQTLSTYFGLYSAQRILALLEAQRETLREIARIVEARRATGAVPQQDEMKAHVEQTRLENEFLLEAQEVVELQSRLNALLNRDASAELVLPREDLAAPKVRVDAKEIPALALSRSRAIESSRFLLEEAELSSSLARQGYLPDFMVSYQKPFTSTPSGAYELGIELSIPLWFFARQTSEVSSASARVIAAEKALEKVRRSSHSQARAFTAKVEALSKILRIYETALIPQATTTLNSSRAAYGAGRVGFQDLLDSERSLYAIRIDYYRTLARFVDNLTQLERITGSSLSSLPFHGDSL